MSGSAGSKDFTSLPTDPAGRETLAGEYVLGTLDARLAVRVALAVQADPLWRRAVEEWEARLGPLGTLVRPESPPPDIWDRIETRIAPQRSPRARRAIRIDWLWRLWALAATAAVAASVAFIYLSRPPATRIMTVLVTDRNAPALLAEVDPKTGLLNLTNFPAPTGRELQAPSERDLQVWGLAPGATAPVSLGVLPHEPGKVTVLKASSVRPVPSMLIEISLEPVGGSPTGKPTGPVVFFGRLGVAGPDT